MSSANKFTDNLNANFKVVYADKIENLIPEGVKLINMISFSGRGTELGQQYQQPVILGHEHGVTFAGPTDDAFALQSSSSGLIKEAIVRGHPMVLRSALGYNAASRSQSGKAAFEDATKFLVRNMTNSMAKKLEITILYGQMGYGIVASVASNTVTIETAEWAPGIFAGANNMPIEIRDSSGAVSRGFAKILSVDMDARSITLDSLPAGTTATDVIWHRGAYGKEMAGIHKILTNTGELFGIDASAFDLFKGNSVDAGSAPLSFAMVGRAVARAVEKGLEGEATLLVNNRTWNDLLTEQAALRQYDSSYKSSVVQNGSEEIMFFNQNGRIKIVPSIYVKEGYSYLLYIDEWTRIGSSDMTFKRPGKEGEFFLDLPDNAGYELRLWSDQAVFTFCPGKNTLISGIVNTEEDV